jgi:hypothetical protein
MVDRSLLYFTSRDMTSLPRLMMDVTRDTGHNRRILAREDVRMSFTLQTKSCRQCWPSRGGSAMSMKYVIHHTPIVTNYHGLQAVQYTSVFELNNYK